MGFNVLFRYRRPEVSIWKNNLAAIRGVHYVWNRIAFSGPARSTFPPHIQYGSDQAVTNQPKHADQRRLNPIGYLC